MLLSQNSEYYYRYCTGGKTGSHDQAGYCLASTAVKNGYSYLCVTLGAPSVDADGARVPVNGAFTDAEALYEWAFDNLEIKTVLEETRSVCDVPLELAWNQDTLLLVPEQNYAAILPVDVAATSVIVTPHLPESVEAPVTRGEVGRHGHAELRRAGACRGQPGGGRLRRAQRTAEFRQNGRRDCQLHLVFGRGGGHRGPTPPLHHPFGHLQPQEEEPAPREEIPPDVRPGRFS